MVNVFVCLLVLFCCQIVFAIETVKNVEINRCMGTWFEIASIPNRWQADCYKNTKSHYAPNQDGTFNLRKSCITKSGQLKEISGTGEVTNPITHAEFKVSFIPLLSFVGWFTGQYKMLLVDPQYRYAVMGEDRLEYGWILARRSNIPNRELAEIEKQIRLMGYDSCKFLITAQESGPRHERKPLCEVVKN